MTEIEYAIVLFESTQNAIKAERALIKRGFQVKLIPTPRRFSANCGTALRCPWCDADAIRDALQSAGVEYSAIEHMRVRQ